MIRSGGSWVDDEGPNQVVSSRFFRPHKSHRFSSSTSFSFPSFPACFPSPQVGCCSRAPTSRPPCCECRGRVSSYLATAPDFSVFRPVYSCLFLTSRLHCPSQFEFAYLRISHLFLSPPPHPRFMRSMCARGRTGTTIAL